MPKSLLHFLCLIYFSWLKTFSLLPSQPIMINNFKDMPVTQIFLQRNCKNVFPFPNTTTKWKSMQKNFIKQKKRKKFLHSYGNGVWVERLPLRCVHVFMLKYLNENLYICSCVLYFNYAITFA